MNRSTPFLDSIRQRAAETEGKCQTCGNLEVIRPGLIGCLAHDKLILPEYPPYPMNGRQKCPEWEKVKEGDINEQN